MHYISEACQKYGIFLALSISPLFPHQYANSRRIACDTWGRIGHTEYCMNAVTGSWWTDRLYQFNDPDHLVMIGNNEEDTSEGENRARLTSGAICGMMLVADNFSPSDTSGRGNCALSRQRAHDLLLNADILDIARRGRTFRPVYGHREFNDRAEGAASLFVRHTDDAVFLAAFNYGQDEMHVDIPLADLGILHPIACISELWMHADVPFSSAIPVSVPARDARVYKISLAK